MNRKKYNSSGSIGIKYLKVLAQFWDPQPHTYLSQVFQELVLKEPTTLLLMPQASIHWWRLSLPLHQVEVAARNPEGSPKLSALLLAMISLLWDSSIFVKREPWHVISSPSRQTQTCLMLGSALLVFNLGHQQHENELKCKVKILVRPSISPEMKCMKHL